MSIIVYDLDDTLRDTSCAVDLIPEDKSKQENWVEWQECVNYQGSTITPVVHMYNADIRDTRRRNDGVWIVTSSQFGTKEWLYNRGIRDPDVLVERKSADNRHPVQYKKDWLSKRACDVVKWVDDNQEVCDFIRETYPHIEVVQVNKDLPAGVLQEEQQLESTEGEIYGMLPHKKYGSSGPPTLSWPKDEMMQSKELPLDAPNKVVIFNGPPRSGKDLATEFCCEYFKGTHASMKTSLIKLTASTLGLTVEEFLKHYDEKCNDKTYEESGCVWVKDLSMYPVNGGYLSKRRALIHVSENVVKPTFGDSVFGKLAADNLPKGLVFFSDGGFPDEIQPIADKVGIENMLIVHIKREGYTFEGDSRDYVNVDGVKTVEVENTTLGKYLADIAEAVRLHINA